MRSWVGRSRGVCHRTGLLCALLPPDNAIFDLLLAPAMIGSRVHSIRTIRSGAFAWRKTARAC